MSDLQAKLAEFKKQQEAEFEALKNQLNKEEDIKGQLNQVLEADDQDSLKIIMNILSPVIIENVNLLDEDDLIKMIQSLTPSIAQYQDKIGSVFFDEVMQIAKPLKNKAVKTESKPRNRTFFILDGVRIKKENADLLAEFSKEETSKVFEEEGKLLVLKRVYKKDLKELVKSKGFKDVNAFFKEYEERIKVLTTETEEKAKTMAITDFDLL